jgi:hypothetical protein
MSFGKRQSTANAPEAAPPALDGNTVPKASPIEPATPAMIEPRLAQGKEALAARTAEALAKAQARFANARLRPFFLIPDPCWSGPSGLFLMSALELYPYDDWNVVFLAADAETAEALDIAPHPDGNISSFITAAEKSLPEAQAQFTHARDEAALTDNPALLADAREDVQLRVKALAMGFARTLIEAWDEQKPA